MPVPKAIREAAEAADAQVAAIIAAESAPLVVDPVTGEPYITTAAPPTPPTPPAPPQDDWEQRFRTLQGKYDSELPVLRSQISNYERINNTLSQQLASLTEQVQTLSTRPVAAATAPADAVTSKDVEQYGAELIDVINRVAEARAQALTTDLRGEIARLQTSVSRDVAGVTAHVKQTDRALYDQKLTEAVPDWRTINIDPEWLRWLGEYDPILGSTRQAALNTAYNNFDAVRTVAFLKSWLATRTPAPRQLTPQEELARQVTPRTTVATPQSPSAPEPTDTRIWTQAEIAATYTAKLQGKYRGLDAEWAAVVKQIDAAVAEGRVR
jgi:hypothetical protein